MIVYTLIKELYLWGVGGGGATRVKFYWVCAAGLSHSSTFFNGKKYEELSHVWPDSSNSIENVTP